MTSPATFRVLPGQVYASCREQAPMTFIVLSVTAGRAYVVDPFGGRTVHGRHLWVSLSSLHPTARTVTGRERRTGYRLLTDAPEDRGWWLCGSCLRYVDGGMVAVAAYGPAAATCVPCKAKIDAMYAPAVVSEKG